MKNINLRLIFAIVALVFTTPCFSFNNYYLGVGLGPEMGVFKQYATISTPGGLIADKTRLGAKGLFASIFAGYALDLDCINPNLSNITMAFEANANISSLKFKSSNSNLTFSNFNSASYKLKESFAFSVLPGCYIFDCTLLYGRFGYGLREFKLSTTEITIPNVNKSLSMFRYGLGIKQFVNEDFAIRFEYGYSTYRKLNLFGFDPAGNTNKITSIVPTSSMFELGIAYHF